MKTLLLTALVLTGLMVTSCGRQSDALRLGIIRPSIDHLPYSYALSRGELPKSVQTLEFATGWELGEALAAGKVDVAILPFSFVWNAVARGFPVRTVSFLERETDAVVAKPQFDSLPKLEGGKIGLLRASSVDLLWRDLARQRGLAHTPVFFRTPSEIIAALKTGDIDAATLYVPLVQKLKPEFEPLHWFGSDHPAHPCCDLAVNTKKLDPSKQETLKSILSSVDKAIEAIQKQEPELLKFMAAQYDLDPAQCQDALRTSIFRTGLDSDGKDFQIGMMQLAHQVGYLHQVPQPSDVYWELK